MKVTLNSSQCKKCKNKDTSFPKESVENADIHKLVWNKIMTTHKLCVKNNFVAPSNIKCCKHLMCSNGIAFTSTY